jgi:branched-chain amino acid transport system substrate-binding protein
LAKWSRTYIALFAGLLWVSAVVAWPRPSAAQTPSGEGSDGSRPRLGVVVPLSGPFAPVGRQVVEAARFAAAERGLELVLRDSEGQPERAIEGVTELAADSSVVAIIGPVGQRESQAAAVAASRLSMPLFTLTSVEAVNQVGPTVFRARQSPAEQARGLARAAREVYGLERAAIFFPANDYGRQAAIAFAETFAQEGGRIVAAHDYAPETTNFSHPLNVLVGRAAHIGVGQRVRGRQADRDGNVVVRNQPLIDFDALFIPDFHHNVARLLPFLPGAGLQTGESTAAGHTDGLAVQLLGLAGWQGDRMAMTGAHAAGAIYVDVFVGRDEGRQPEAFAMRFERELGRGPVDLEAETYDLVMLLADAIDPGAAGQGQEQRRRALLSAVRERRDFVGICGALSFGSQGEPVRPTRLFRFDVGGVVVPLIERPAP